MAHYIRGFFDSSRESGRIERDTASSSSGNEDDRIDVPNNKMIRLDSEISVPRRKAKRKYNKQWEKLYAWSEYSEEDQGAFCRICNTWSRRHGQKAKGVWVTIPFNNWKNALEKMKIHAQSNQLKGACQIEMAGSEAQVQGTIIQQFQQIGESVRVKNRMIINILIRSTHFLVRHHIPHTAVYEDLVKLISNCRAQDLKYFTENAARNATYLSKFIVVEFVQALGKWVDESLMGHIRQCNFYSIMTNECTDVSTLEELSIYYRWVENGLPVEHFLDILPFKRANAETITGALIACLKNKQITLTRLIGMGFDGAVTFSGKKSGVQTRLKMLSPHALYVHCHCHRLQLACVQAANETKGIKNVYKVEILSLFPQTYGIFERKTTGAEPPRIKGSAAFRYTLANT